MYAVVPVPLTANLESRNAYFIDEPMYEAVLKLRDAADGAVVPVLFQTKNW